MSPATLEKSASIDVPHPQESPRKVSTPKRLPTLDKYRRHLAATAQWLVRSIENGQGGSAAHYMAIRGWAPPYPETTGYIIPTLLALAEHVPAFDGDRLAMNLGEWLLSIQHPEGFWHGGLHRRRRVGKPSVFNTAQVLRGLAALHDRTKDARWLDSAHRGAAWLSRNVNAVGSWPAGDYRSAVMPAYYSYAASSMLRVGVASGDELTRTAAARVLDAVLGRRQNNGVFSGWGFEPGKPAFTHTIAYTLQGLLESADILEGWDRYATPAQAALNTLLRRAELTGGRLPGSFTDDWRPSGGFVCLTGNAQVALCLLALDRHSADLRLVNAAAKLLDYVCATQFLASSFDGVRGGVAGSAPVWGKYMTLRYPNWSAKYHCDALMTLIRRIEDEL